MVKIEVCTESINPSLYRAGCRFAKNVYRCKSRVNINPDPDALCVARHPEGIVGCFGFYSARDRRPLTTEKFWPELAEEIPELEDRREKVGELGTYAIAVETPFDVCSKHLSVGMIISLIRYVRSLEVEVLMFTASTAVGALLRLLRVDTTVLGPPNIDICDEDFRLNWRQYFRKKRLSYVIYIDDSSLRKNRHFVKKLRKQNYLLCQ